jgi:protein-tyrosine phosphatase
MIDIHCHILYGIDDGADDMKESIEMARLAYQDGIRHIIATPHFSANYFNHKEIVQNKVKELQENLNLEQIPITIHPGNEVRLESADFIYEHAREENFCFLGNHSKFILLEQTWKQYCEETIEIVKWFQENGKVIILPHPERHFFFRKNPLLLKQLIDLGCWTQVSVDSMLGKNSDEVKDFSTWLLENNYVHTLATDAHNIHRKPNLSEGFRLVAALAGKQRAEEILKRMDSIL